MVRLQELIHKIELGEWARALKIGTAALALVALTVWYDLREYKNFHAPEAMDAAQVARNLATGKGFTTQCIRPLSLCLVGKKLGVAGRLSRGPHPDLANPPVYPLVLAGLMKVLPFKFEIPQSIGPYQAEMIIALFNQLLFFGMVLVVYLLARRLFDASVAVLTAALLLGSDLLWKFSVSGLSTLLLLLLVAALAVVLVRLERGAREEQHGPGWFAGWAAVVGLLLGLGALTRYSFAWLALPALAFCALFLGARRGVVCGLIVVVMMLMVTPWLARNYYYSGTLFGLPGFAIHQDTPAFPENRLERSLEPELSKLVLDDYFRKLLINGADIMQNDLPKLGGSWVTAFFLVGLLLPFRSPALNRLRFFVVASLVVLAVAQALGRTHLSAATAVTNTENLLVLMAPLVFMYGTALFLVLLDQLSLPFREARIFAMGAFGLVGCASLVFTLLPPRNHPIVYPPYLAPWIRESSGFLQQEELMMSDMPWAVAWYGNRSCVWTTLDSGKSFYRVYDDQRKVSALYLTPLTTDARFLTQIVRGPDWDWARVAADVMMRTNLPTHFPLKDARSGYLPDQLLLSDRPRWKEPPPPKPELDQAQQK
jgi:hypothetical protein